MIEKRKLIKLTNGFEITDVLVLKALSIWLY